MLTDNGKNPFFVNAVTYFLLSISCIVPVILLGFNFSLIFFKYSLIVGLLGAIGNGFLVKALSCGELSVLGPINSYKAVFALIIGIIFLEEIPDVFALFGIVLIIVGSFFVLSSSNEGITFSLLKRKDLQYRFLALVFTAAEAVFIKKLILISNIFQAFASWCVFGFIFGMLMVICLVFVKKINIKKECEIFKTKAAFNFLAIFLFTLIMQYTTNYVFNHMKVAYALSLFQLSALLSVVLGYKIFKEADFIRKLVGSFVMILGAVLIFLFH